LQWVIIENTKGTHYNEAPPEVYDDIHIPGSLPFVTLRTPSDGERLYTRDIKLTADVLAPRRINRVEFYFDTFFIGSDFVPPYTYIYRLPGSIKGQTHTFTVRAYDDIENLAENVRTITIDSASGVVIEETGIQNFLQETKESVSSTSLLSSSSISLLIKL